MSNPSPAPPDLEDEAPFVIIRWLLAFLRVLEDLITNISGYSILLALGIGSVDLFSLGKLTTNFPWVEVVYAVSLAIGISGQLIAVTVRSARAFRNGNAWAGVGFSVIALLLAGVEWEASTVYGYHVIFSQPVAQSLAQLGISQQSFIQIRNGVAVMLTLLSGYLRYQPKAKKSAAEIEAEEADKRRIARAKNATRQEQLKGVLNAGRAAIGKEIVEESTPETTPDSGEIAAANTQEIDTESAPLWLPTGKVRWQEIRRWVEVNYGLKISEQKAKDIIKAAGGSVFPRAGNPVVATQKRAETQAKKLLNLDRITPNPFGDRAVND